jgi:osmotically-inducible protein OsmY
LRWLARRRLRSLNGMQQDILRQTILEELRRDPSLDASRITVSIGEREIVLDGVVRSYSEKCRAETIAHELSITMNVVNVIEVRLSIGHYRTDAGLTHLTNEVLENYVVLTDEPPVAAVHDGWVTLRGVVTSDFRRSIAEAIVRELTGVRGITNEIRVR